MKLKRRKVKKKRIKVVEGRVWGADELEEKTTE